MNLIAEERLSKMFEVNKTIEELKQNMKDAGCTTGEINRFIPIWQSGNKSESIKLLSKQRKVLLQSIHKDQAELEFLEGLLTAARK